MNSNELVKLTPPIPWCSLSGRTGFINEISVGRLHLELSRHQESLSGDEELTLNLPFGGGAYAFKGVAIDGSEKGRQELLVENKETLKDLLGKVRKDQHIEICRSDDVEASSRYTGFEKLQFTPNALPELDEESIDTSICFLGSQFSFPMMIAGMTGGIAKGSEINRRLARAAAHFRIPMGIGSQRLALDNPKYNDIFRVKQDVPDVFLVGNVGGAQLLERDPIELCQRAVDMVEADALAIHLNVLQESIQVEGDRHFRGLLDVIQKICNRLDVPVLVKEVGCGVSGETALILHELGISGIDIGGKGGTSWGYIEGLRSSSRETRNLGNIFRDWGIPTAYSVASVRQACPGLPIVATGGVRSGLDIAKAMAVGAQMAGIGLPLLRAALESEEAVFNLIGSYSRGLRITMMASGCQSLGQLASRVSLGEPLESEFIQYVKSLGSGCIGGGK